MPLIELRCPTCRAPVVPPDDNPAFPFCSERCRLVDLGRWVDGRYAIDPASGRLDVIDPETAEEFEPEQ